MRINAMLGMLVGVLVASARLAAADCVEEAAADKLAAAAAKTTAAHYDDALKKLKLRPIALRPVLTEPPKYSGSDKFLVVTTNGEAAVMLDDPLESCGGPDAPATVEDGAQVFFVERREKPGASKRVGVCTCDLRVRGCGAAPHVIATGYALPKGKTFGGVKVVEYVADRVAIDYGVGQKAACRPAPSAK